MTSFNQEFFCSIMKAAACGTWLGDLITALIVTDMMLQDNLYPNWAPSVRYSSRRNTYIYIFVFRKTVIDITNSELGFLYKVRFS